MGTGNCVTTLSGGNQQSNLDKIDNWETTRKYLFDRIFLYTEYSLILQIYFQRKKFISIYVKRRDFKRNQSIVSNGKKIRNMDSVTAAEWLQCLTSKLRCCSIFSAWKVLWLLWKTPGRNFMIALKNTREEFHDLLWKTPGRKRRRRPTTWRPFPSSPRSTMSDIQRALICNFFRISIIMIDNIMISSIKSSPPSTINIQSALFRSNHSILNI